MPFVFFDVETTGTNTAFDQVVQFAAVRTDDRLNELEVFEVRSRLLPTVVPSPVAMRVNGVTVEQLADPALPSHYEMVRRIRQKLLPWSPAVFVGFNSLDFDEHMLRQAFYKTLHPPYLTNTRGNSRCDAMRLIQASTIFAPGALAVPTIDGTRKTYKLDRLAPANGFDHEDAHDALADVRATIHLCRMLREAAPQFWSSAIRLCRKSAAIDFVMTQHVFGLTEFFWGRGYSCVVSMIGHDDSNDNHLYVANLAVDPRSLAGLSEPALRLRVGQRPKPVRCIRANAAPTLWSIDTEKDEVFPEALGADVYELARRAAFLEDNANLRARLISAFEAGREPHEPSPHVEKQIYDGFPTDADNTLMNSFHEASWPDRLAIVERFQDARLHELGCRLIHCERPDLLDDVARRRHDERIARCLLGLDNAVGWLTLREAVQQANDILVETNLPHIRAHRDFLQRRLADAMRLAL
ncbi:MAG TPA: exonuclease domain-containing protein [Stellaceae bacterium]|nr:exonuclease domain-containing protein [Stellaceae bacterium]